MAQEGPSREIVTVCVTEVVAYTKYLYFSPRCCCLVAALFSLLVKGDFCTFRAALLLPSRCCYS